MPSTSNRLDIASGKRDRSTVARTARGVLPAIAIAVACSAAHGARSGGCSADLIGAGLVNVMSLFQLLNNWGPNPGHQADFNEDGVVDGWDLGYMLAHWGPCSSDLPLPPEGTAAPIIEESTSDDAAALGLRTFDVSFQFGAADDVLLNVFNANLSCDLSPCLAHAMPFSFPPQSTPFSQALIDGADVTWDSFVTIGAEVSDDSDVTLDPNFDMETFTSDGSLGVDAGWFTFPSNPEARAGSHLELRVLIARLTVPEGTTVSGAASVMWLSAEGLPHLDHVTIVVPPANSADLDGDGIVDGADLGLMLNAWGPCRGCPADLNGDGIVDGADLGLLLSQWG